MTHMIDSSEYGTLRVTSLFDCENKVRQPPDWVMFRTAPCKSIKTYTIYNIHRF
jgi:hypothetical protein